MIVGQGDILFVLILFEVLDSRPKVVERLLLKILFVMLELNLHYNKHRCLNGIPNDVSILTEMFPFDYFDVSM